MGRLPKGFSAKKRDKQEATPEAPPAQERQQQTAAQSEPNSSQQASSATDKAGQQEAPPPPPDSDEDREGNGPETRGQVIQRHKREMQAFKKNLQRMGKKSKDELAAMNSEIEARHKRELQEVEQREKQAEEPAQELSGLRLGTEAEARPGPSEEHASSGGGKATKAMKRREKAQREEAEREARIAEEAAAAGPSARAQEEEALGRLLAPLGLRMREIKADGHCLYRSLEDQLQLHLALEKSAATDASNGSSSGSSSGLQPLQYQQLREAAAAHIRAHPDEYLPFILSEEDTTNGADDGLSAVERYCQELESTASWGGQLELSVLAQVLKRPIKVYAAGLPTVTLGDEFEVQGPPLQVCYLRHAFGLGEHYNSLGSASEDVPS
mmetsp:Transcript_15010/g.39716  ORF Transcript_15010/g.39716 Transcript_15010/m.39716 type:complete len:383 (+) Transcript_15010:1527-2675(+)|eukprot:CAMPEP_0202374464 /NCGR_PEP_ID=MMETSP1127-20130417/5292_1 /ASSEMBLY_ACC=CAM_ASM_000462 /TAXON_ID=3047 /ORGANISM="Dunaliella tertiolecta, Strain CCMP1320" /LENGTH=382 /DNA_ID=CAMNT_0048971627 /DNA_START=2047 /DNA_END=3195 /DNA_ORIENTATION=-